MTARAASRAPARPRRARARSASPRRSRRPAPRRRGRASGRIRPAAARRRRAPGGRRRGVGLRAATSAPISGCRIAFEAALRVAASANASARMRGAVEAAVGGDDVGAERGGDRRRSRRRRAPSAARDRVGVDQTRAEAARASRRPCSCRCRCRRSGRCASGHQREARPSRQAQPQPAEHAVGPGQHHDQPGAGEEGAERHVAAFAQRR